MAERSSKRLKLSQALARAPQRLIETIQKLLQDGNDWTSQPVRLSKKVAREILQPCWNCYQELQVAATEGPPLKFFAANLQRLLEHVLEKSPKYNERWTLPLGGAINVVLYLDECTGGNVLATNSSKKIAFFYLGVDEVGKLLHHQMWLPYAMMPARDIAMVSGGLSALTATVLRHFHAEQIGGLRICGNHYTINLKAYVGDYDSIARMYMSKGAAGLKPCLLRANVLSSRSDVPSVDNHFLSIASSQTDKFQPVVPAELHSLFDELLVACHGSTKALRVEQERNFGYSLHPDSLLNCSVSRELMPISKVVFDSCHCYYANGATATEILLFQARMEERLGIDLKQIQSAVGEVKWMSHDKNFSSSSARRYLFEPALWAGTSHKGSASQVWALLPLLFYMGYVLGKDILMRELQCFSALMEAS
eukprot:Skav222053  [mRNA]  locus=scaffold1020:532279:533544:+ [translate_table: standard]